MDIPRSASQKAIVEAEATTEAGTRKGPGGWATFASLRHRDYRLLWFGTLFSSSGQWIQQTSIGWLTYDLTGSAMLLGVVNGLRAVPLLILGPFGGVAADRLNRKHLMFFTQLFLVAVTAGFATIIMTGHARVWNVIVFTVLTGVAWAFNMPVRQSVLPSLVPREDLSNAIALNSVIMNSTRILGPSVAGLLIAWVGVAGNFYLQAAACCAVASMIWQMNVPVAQQTNRSQSVLRNLAEGAAYTWHHRTLRSLMILALVPTLFAFPYAALMPIFAKDILHRGSTGFGIMMAAPGIGAVVGTLWLASLRSIEHRGRMLFIALVALGLGLVAFSYSRSFALSLGILILIGAFQIICMTTNMTLLQLTVPDEFRGRVIGIYMLDQGLVPLGSLLIGALASAFSAPVAVFVMGLAVSVLGILAAIMMPAMRRV